MLWKQQKKSVKMGMGEWKKEERAKRARRVGADEACDSWLQGPMR